ncbi:hypothetical protein [Helicobacter magdeburgensis]|nr:hypothetical protein [Helicobacter magdeburgensis]
MRFNFMVTKSCFATLAIVESALDSALAESQKSMLHTKRESLLSPASWCIKSDSRRAEVSRHLKRKNKKLRILE